MKKEANILKSALLKATTLGARLSRMNVGLAWQGRKVERFEAKTHVVVFPGDVVLRQAVPFRTGVPKGYSDLSGFTAILITSSMVGTEIAQFVAAEIKTKDGKPSVEQLNFLDMVQSKGGKAGIVRCDEDIEELLT